MVTFTLWGSLVEYSGVRNEEEGLRFMCTGELRYNGLRPIAGPSWPGLAVSVVTSLYDPANCAFRGVDAFRCNPPPFDAVDQAAMIAGRVASWGSTISVARCKWVCAASLQCGEGQVEAVGVVRNVSAQSVECVVPEGIGGKLGRLEIQVAGEAGGALRMAPALGPGPWPWPLALALDPSP